MGFSSQAGHVVFVTQGAEGTYTAPSDTVGIRMKLRSGSLGPNRELLIPDPEIGGGRDVNDAYLGAVSWSGDYEFYARMNALTTLLAACLGSTTSDAPVGGVSTHTITPSDASALPFLSVEEKIGAGLEVYNYTDAVVNTFHLEAEANGYLMGTAGLIAKKQIAGATEVPETVSDDTPMIVGTNITVTYNGVTLPAKTFSIDINNNFEDDDFRLGSFYIGDLTPKRREITASFSIRETSSALWRQAVYGTNTATAPGGITTKAPLVINMNTYEDIPASAPPVKYGLSLTFPNFMLSPYALSVSGDDIIESDLDGQAVRPVLATPIVTAVVKNNAEVA
jgi:hypothetical protein